MTDQKSYSEIIKAQNLKCPCRGLDDYCACNNIFRDVVAPAFDWEDLADDIAEAISDSIDMDWSPRIGARYVVEMLKKRKPPLPDTDTREAPEQAVSLLDPEPPAKLDQPWSEVWERGFSDTREG